jgi:hypothetical protein
LIGQKEKERSAKTTMIEGGSAQNEGQRSILSKDGDCKALDEEAKRQIGRPLLRMRVK